MERWQDSLAAAVAAITGKAEERAVESLFSTGVVANPADSASLGDWEVVGWYAILPRPDRT